MGHAGRPKWIPQAADIAAIERMAGQGMSKAEICSKLSINNHQLNREIENNIDFGNAYARGHTNTIDKVTGWLMQVMENPSDKALGARVQAVKFWLMHVAGWRDKQELTGEGGGPIDVAMPSVHEVLKNMRRGKASK